MNLATIDIGTNTTLLLVARAAPAIDVIEERAEITGLAIARNRLRVAAIGDAVDAYVLNILQRG